MATRLPRQDVERRRRARPSSTEARVALDVSIDQARRRRKMLIAVHYTLFTTDILALMIGFAVANLVVYGTSDFGQVARVLVISIPLMIGFGLNHGIYGPRPADEGRVNVIHALKPLAMTASALMVVAFMLKVGAQFSRAQFVIGTSLSGALLCCFRIGIARFCDARDIQSAAADLHIFDGVPVMELSAGHVPIDAKLCGLISDLGNARAINHLGFLARGMDTVVVHCPAEARLAWASVLRTLDVPVEIVIPELEALDALHIRNRGTQCSVRLSDGRLTWDRAFLKRAFDLLVVSVTLPILVIVVIIVGILIKIDSRGPVFFRQDRIGIGNRPFRIWKFRSMQWTGRNTESVRLTQRGDPRVTRVGGLLRRLSIDELPQLLNVLAGDMSLVGPRPHAAMARAGTRLYWEVDQFYWQRHVVKPGITGLAQVRGFRGNTFQEDNLRDRLRADLEYVRNWSLLLDIRILLGTLAVPFHRNAF